MGDLTLSNYSINTLCEIKTLTPPLPRKTGATRRGKLILVEIRDQILVLSVLYVPSLLDTHILKPAALPLCRGPHLPQSLLRKMAMQNVAHDAGTNRHLFLPLRGQSHGGV